MRLECGKGHPRVASGTVFTTESEDKPLHTELAALRNLLPNAIAGIDTQSLRYEVDSTDHQSIYLTDLRSQIDILSNTIRYVRYLELKRGYLRWKNKALAANVISLI
jgi:hypothetical protein